MPRLTITTNEGKMTYYTFSDNQLILGRSPKVNYTLKDPLASRKHARIFQVADSYYLEDLKSQNGTYINKKRIKFRAKLKNNDNFQIGNTSFIFLINEEKLEINNYFCGYKLLKKVSTEQTGNIYLAQQTLLERNILLWILPFEILGQDVEKILTIREKFIDQISSIANLFHRNLWMVMDFAATNQYCFCAFEEVDIYSNVRHYLKRYPHLSVSKILKFGKQVASALNYAHHHNIMHLHLTSKNILIQPEQQERIVLTEFGVSKFLSETTIGEFTKSTGILGVSDYIAPEQIQGDDEPCEKTDIYAYGCFLYQLATGEPPFPSKFGYELAQAHLSKEPEPLDTKRKDFPKDLAALIYKALNKKMDKRFNSFQEILDELDRIKEHLEVKNLLNTDFGSTLLEKYVGEKSIKKWWIILPLLSIILGFIAFFVIPLLFQYLDKS